MLRCLLKYICPTFKCDLTSTLWSLLEIRKLIMSAGVWLTGKIGLGWVSEELQNQIQIWTHKSHLYVNFCVTLCSMDHMYGGSKMQIYTVYIYPSIHSENSYLKIVFLQKFLFFLVVNSAYLSVKHDEICYSHRVFLCLHVMH